MIYDLKEVINLSYISFGESEVLEIQYITIHDYPRFAYKILNTGFTHKDVIPKYVYDRLWHEVYGIEKHIIEVE
jgi:hypothetical protein